MNYREIIKKGTSILSDNAIFNADYDAELLLCISLKKSRENILLNLEDKLSYNQIKNYLNLINRRKNNEPISNITSNKFFWKYEFMINNNVLTPRFETELLVEEILRIYKYSEDLRILDIGIGSGCILISLLKEKKKWKGDGLDISKFALKIAKTNAKIQQVWNRIKFIKTDIDNFNSSKYDLIVSNPPYINRIEYNNLGLEVKGYEPIEALYGGIDGLKIIGKVIKKSNKILKYNGLLAIEMGLGQHYKVFNLLRDNGYYILKVVKDFQNIKRCIIAKKIN